MGTSPILPHVFSRKADASAMPPCNGPRMLVSTKRNLAHALHGGWDYRVMLEGEKSIIIPGELHYCMRDACDNKASYYRASVLEGTISIRTLGELAKDHAFAQAAGFANADNFLDYFKGLNDCKTTQNSEHAFSNGIPDTTRVVTFRTVPLGLSTAREFRSADIKYDRWRRDLDRRAR